MKKVMWYGKNIDLTRLATCHWLNCWCLVVGTWTPLCCCWYLCARLKVLRAPGGASGDEPAASAAGTGGMGAVLGPESLGEGPATHSRVLAWRVPWAERPGGLRPLGPHRAGHSGSDLARMQTVKRSFSILECYLKLNQPSFFMLWPLSAGSTLDLKCHSLVTPAALCFNFPVWALWQSRKSELAGWNPTALNSGSGY